jgi:hypothetical protein
MSSDLPCNCRYAETIDEEIQAENEMERQEGYGVDEVYDRIRDDDSEFLMESVKELIDKLSKLMYYKNRNEGLAKDIIQNTLEKLKLKIGSVENISPQYQRIDLIKKEEVLING